SSVTSSDSSLLQESVLAQSDTAGLSCPLKSASLRMLSGPSYMTARHLTGAWKNNVSAPGVRSTHRVRHRDERRCFPVWRYYYVPEHFGTVASSAQWYGGEKTGDR